MRVIFAGGGTGGHLYPGIALAREFIRREGERVDILFVGTAAGVENRVCPKEGFKLELIRSKGLIGRSLVGRIGALLTAFLGLFDSMRVLLCFRPDIVVGTGGYACAPLVLAAALTRRKVILLEPNFIPGLTNKLLAPFVSMVMLAFCETESYLKWCRCMMTGNPVRYEISSREYEVRAEVKILVFGGSLGASSINRAVVESLEYLDGTGFKFVHQSGEKDFEMVKDAYRKRKIEADVARYIYDIPGEYENASLVICRAGATTVAELTAMGMPAILIPYPFAVDDHQLKNAMALKKNGAAEVLKEEDLNGKLLAGVIKNILLNRESLLEMSKNSSEMGNKKAASVIYEYCMGLL